MASEMTDEVDPGSVLWLSGDDRLIEIAGMWLRPSAIWAVRPGYASEGACCVVTGSNGAEFRLPDVSAHTVVQLLNGDDSA